MSAQERPKSDRRSAKDVMHTESASHPLPAGLQPGGTSNDLLGRKTPYCGLDEGPLSICEFL